MRLLTHAVAVIALSSVVPAFAQNAAPAPVDTSAASADFASLREQLSIQNKGLMGDVATQRAIVKKNQDLLKEAMRIDAQNKKLVAERQKLAAENVDLEKRRAALQTASTPAPESASAATMNTGSN